MSCGKGMSVGIASIEVSPPVTLQLNSQTINELGAKNLDRLFGNQSPSLTFSTATIEYKTDDDGRTFKIERNLNDFGLHITHYYDKNLDRHQLEPGDYTIAGFTMSGSVSRPVVISIASTEESASGSDGAMPGLSLSPLSGIEPLVSSLILFGGISTVAATTPIMAARAKRIPIGSRDSFGLEKMALVLLIPAMLIVGGTVSFFPPAYAATWEKGAQGIQVTGTGSEFNVMAAQSDIKGWNEFLDTGECCSGVSTMLNGYLSGITTGTNYIFVNAIGRWYTTTTAYVTETCLAWPEGLASCSRVDSIYITPFVEFISEDTFFNTCNSGSAPNFWSYDSLYDNCYKRYPSSDNPTLKNIGASGYKRFNFYEYISLNSDGKVTYIVKFQRCTTQTSCGAYETVVSGTTPSPLTSSNQKITSCNSCLGDGQTYYPNIAIVGYDSGLTFRAKSGTYIETNIDANDATSPSGSYKKCTSTNMCTSPGEANDDVCWWTTVGNTGQAKNFKSSLKYNTSCHSGAP